MSNNNVVEINNRDTITDALTDMLRTGAQQLIQQAVQFELAEFMSQYTDRLTDKGKAAVVRNGYQPERNTDGYWFCSGQDSQSTGKRWKACYFSFGTGAALCQKGPITGSQSALALSKRCF